MTFPDAHIHIAEVENWTSVESSPVCACAHSENDFLKLEQLALSATSRVVKSFGVHPQNPDLSLLSFLEQLLVENRIDAIGETGFDLFTPAFTLTLEQQEKVWTCQLDLALQYEKPVIVHCRKAVDKLFQDTKKLSRIKAVVFHSFPGSVVEANTLLRRGINAYFTCGKQILNGNKKAIACSTLLPIDRIIGETDAPYQTLKGEIVTQPQAIIKVYNKIAELRKLSIQEICAYCESSFDLAFSTADVSS